MATPEIKPSTRIPVTVRFAPPETKPRIHAPVALPVDTPQYFGENIDITIEDSNNEEDSQDLEGLPTAAQVHMGVPWKAPSQPPTSKILGITNLDFISQTIVRPPRPRNF